MPLDLVPKDERDYLKRAVFGAVLVLGFASLGVWLHAHGRSEHPGLSDYLPGGLLVFALAVVIVGTIIFRFRFFQRRARKM